MTTEQTMQNIWSNDELCEHAFSIFEELAQDNLTAADYALYQQHAESAAYVDLVTPVQDWQELFGGQPDAEQHVEAMIGLSQLGAQGCDLVLATILLSRDKDESLCHAKWRGQA